MTNKKMKCLTLVQTIGFTHNAFFLLYLAKHKTNEKQTEKLEFSFPLVHNTMCTPVTGYHTQVRSNNNKKF